jgi:hypothetical protein
MPVLICVAAFLTCRTKNIKAGWHNLLGGTKQANEIFKKKTAE